MAHYNPDGSLDMSFDTDGKVTSFIDFHNVALQNDGKILVTGNYECHDFTVARYNKDGSLDSSFGTLGGIVQTSIGTNSKLLSYDIAQQADGKIVVAGSLLVLTYMVIIMGLVLP